jgi:DNA-binding MarR family transcriptional regulator
VEREGARLRDLAQASGVTASAMTRNIQRLEARGLVERVRGSQPDKREAMVRITGAGRCLRQQLDQLMLARAESLWHAMPASTRRTTVQALRVLNDAFATAGCCPLNQPVPDLSAVGKNLKQIARG